MANWKEVIQEGKSYFCKFNNGTSGSYVVKEILREEPTNIYSRPDMLILESESLYLVNIPWHAVSFWTEEEE